MQALHRRRCKMATDSRSSTQRVRSSRAASISTHPEWFELEIAGERVFVNVPGAEQIAVVGRRSASTLATWHLQRNKAHLPMAAAPARAPTVCGDAPSARDARLRYRAGHARAEGADRGTNASRPRREHAPDSTRQTRRGATSRVPARAAQARKFALSSRVEPTGPGASGEPRSQQCNVGYTVHFRCCSNDRKWPH
jgi:hypothetical protein